MTWQYLSDFQLLGLANYVGPIRDIRVGGIVIRTVGHGVARAQDSLFGEIDEAIAARVGPTEVMKFHTPRGIFEHKQILVESLLGRLGLSPVQLGDVLALLGGLLPALR